MILTQRLQHALDLAAVLHRDHNRIGKDNTPYITHLFAVAIIVEHYGGSEDAVVAGLLHDTVEDIDGYTLEMLRSECGARVAEIVQNLTEPRDFSADANPKERWVKAKRVYLDQLSGADQDTLIVSASDKIHNMQSILAGMAKGDDLVKEKFSGEALKGQLWFWSEVLAKIDGKVPQDLQKLFEETLANMAYMHETGSAL